MTVDSAGLVVLTTLESLALLATATVGRVGISSQALPLILAVHFTLDVDRILFRTGAGSTLAAATRGSVVAFEVDGPAASMWPLWSVVVTGVATHLDECDDGVVLEQFASPDRWTPVEQSRAVSISTERVTGRRLRRDLCPWSGQRSGSRMDP